MRIAQLPDFQQKLRALSTDSIGSSSAEFIKTIESETAMWSDVAKRANVSIKR